MTDVFRTPEERFEKLPEFPYEPTYREVDGLRVAHVDVGEGAPVVLIHGSPAWSFVWRKVIPPLRDAGYRCVAPDNAGYGRSDKPTDPRWYSVARHAEITSSLLEELDLREATLVAHDWGGPVGLTVTLWHPDRVARVVLLDTAVDPRDVWMNEAWVRVREFVLGSDELAIGELMRATCAHDPGDDVVAAYAAPFPTPESTAALKGGMMMISEPDDPDGIAAAEAFADELRRDPRPMLIVWGDADLLLTLASGQRLAARLGRRVDHVIPGAGHGLQEDAGEEIGRLVVEWLGER